MTKDQLVFYNELLSKDYVWYIRGAYGHVAKELEDMGLVEIWHSNSDLDSVDRARALDPRDIVKRKASRGKQHD